MFRLWSQIFLWGLLATGTEAAVKSVTPRRVTTKTATVWEIVTSSFVETLYERQEGLCDAGGSLEFCSDVRSQWFYSNEFGSMNSTGGNPSATTTTKSPSASASAEFQQILSGSAFQLFVTQENGTIAYVSINSDGFAYLIGSRTGQLFQWSESTLKTYETSPRSFLALPDNEASRRNIRLADRQTLTNSTNRGTIKASEIIPDGASTNFTLILRQVDTELVLTWEQREALFGTGAGCTTNLAAPDSVLAFGTADDYDTLPGCAVVSLSARVASGVSSLSSDVNTGTDTQTASGSSSSGASRSASRSPSQSGVSNGSNSPIESSGSSDSSDNDSITSVSSSSGSNLPSSTDSGPITSNSGSSTTSASPGSSGTSSPSNTDSPESCSGTTCSSSSSDSSSSVSSTTWGCVTETPIPASLSCPNHVEWDYITLDKDVYSLCTGYSISLTSSLTTDADAINPGTISLLPCLESCVSAGYEGALFSAHAQWGFTKNTWQCGCGTTTNNFVLPTVSPIGMFTSKTAAVFICSNTFDYTGSTNNPARDTITVPPVSECYLPVTDKVSAFKRCPYNTANTWQNVIYSDGQVVTSLCRGAKFATTSDLFPWSTFTTYPIPVDMTTCLQSCSAAVGYPNTCPGVALVVDSTSLSNGYRAKCVMATGDDLALITTDPAVANTLRWLTAGEHLCPNGFALPSCAAAIAATPSTATCCPGVRSQHLYTWGSSVFNICEGLIAGASPMYQCVKMGANDATMTSTIPVNAGTSFYGTNVAFLCTNTFALQPSQPITSDLAPVYQICTPATQFLGFVIWPSIFATTKALYDWGGLAVTTSDLLTAGCTYGCTENNGKRPSDQPTWGQPCMVAVTASAKYWEVVREKGNDGKCYCRWPQDSVAAQAFTLSSYTVNTDVIEVYAYTSPGS
ncbi:hypothetical protein TWF970_004827 [Orbilia oligospora]|uniref:Uncharacterized protein n=1 Tax=Orbilia oligospora TaxID=2813651 RepID=A0A7C8V5G9_ORBOL|nr:hypothetical protein TWF970_004827 [Orbilia oligospora]